MPMQIFPPLSTQGQSIPFQCGQVALHLVHTEWRKNVGMNLAFPRKSPKTMLSKREAEGQMRKNT